MNEKQGRTKDVKAQVPRVRPRVHQFSVRSLRDPGESFAGMAVRDGAEQYICGEVAAVP